MPQYPLHLQQNIFFVQFLTFFLHILYFRLVHSTTALHSFNFNFICTVEFRLGLLWFFSLIRSLFWFRLWSLIFSIQEGIHRRWDSGYRITSTAATWDQAALILSVPRRKPGDETQETLRTSQFPSTHVKVNVGKSVIILDVM